MKNLIFVVCALLLSISSFAQNFDGVVGHIKNGNATGLSEYFQGNVEITIKDAEASYSKVQAEQILKNFFASNQPRSFTVAHEGTSPEGSKYFIGTLSTSSGSYRTYVNGKSSGGSISIQQIRFEAQ